MAPRNPRPLFLAPTGYRQKRVRDAARVLPVLGAMLFLIPLLWTPSDAPGGVGNAAALLYVFVVWAALIVATFALSRLLRPDTEEARAEEDGA